MGSSWVVFLRQILNMADKDKKKKKKAAAEPDTTPEAPPSTPASSVKKPSGKKAKRGNSNVFETFSQLQVAEFKEGFQFMDRDKDGMIGKGDIRATADEVGKLLSDAEIDEMLADAPGPINFTMLINMLLKGNRVELLMKMLSLSRPSRPSPQMVSLMPMASEK